MPAPKENKFWQARSRHGRKPLFESPIMLWESCLDYLNWVEENPLWETKVFHSNGIITTTEVPKMRAMTISGLCIFIDMTMETWSQYRQKEDFSEVCKEVEQIIYNQKFQGAAADFLNANIIARDLGLADKQDRNIGGQPGNPVEHKVVFIPAKLDD